MNNNAMHKPRAWHIEEKRMFEVRSIFFEDDWVEVYEERLQEYYEPFHENSPYKVWKEVILMQSTGLKDMEWNELREWDLLKFHSKDHNEMVELVIKNSSVDFVWRQVDEGMPQSYIGSGLEFDCAEDEAEDLVKVWNAYSNPELLAN